MRVLAVKGMNLASLEGEFCINFNEEPLKSTGLFAITGPTGSGKSTILDAICLALYDTTPRFKRGNGSTRSKDVGNNTLSQNDPKNILRRGTVQGYAEVTFSAVDGKVYSAKWSVRRARNSIKGALQDVDYSVYNVTDGRELKGTKTELKRAVEALVGLNFEQFTRAVLLAQGDFAAFLMADKNSKAELLKKITGSNIYSRISVRIYERFKEAQTALSVVNERIGGVNLLSDDEMAVVRGRLDSLTVAKGSKEVYKTEMEKLYEWHKTLHNIKESCSLAERCLNEKTVAASLLGEKRIYVKRIRKAYQIKDVYAELQLGRKGCNDATTKLKSTEKRLLEQTAQLQVLKNREKELSGSLNSLNIEWRELDPKLKNARNIEQTIKGLLVQKVEAEKSIDGFSKDIELGKKQLIDIKAETDRRLQEQERVTKWQGENGFCCVVAENHAVITKHISDFYEADRRFAGYSNKKVSMEAELSVTTAGLDSVEAELVRLDALLPAEVAALRNGLVEGKPCPVCGSVHHYVGAFKGDTAKADDIDAARGAQQMRKEKLLETVDKLRRDISSVAALVEECERNRMNALTAIAKYMGGVNDWQTRLLDSKLQKLADDSARYWNASVERLKSVADAIRNSEDKGRLTNERIKFLERQLAVEQERLKSVNEDVESAGKELFGLFNGESADKIESDFVARRSLMEEKSKELGERNVTLQNKVSACKAAITQLNDLICSNKCIVDRAKGVVDDWKRDNNEDDPSSLLAVPESELARMEGEIKSADEEIVFAKATLDERRMALEAHIKCRPVVMPKIGSEAKLDMSGVDLNGKDDLEGRIASINGEIEVINSNIIELSALVKQNDDNIRLVGQLVKERGVRETELAGWSKLNSVFGSANGDKLNTLVQCYTLDILLGYANRHLSALTGRYTLRRTGDDSLGLEVVDHDMLNEVRGVNSLSGGESFLVSLALALGLSSLASNRMNVESLFIDEGFGSLDSQTLTVAMEALERLQSHGRKIGIISHVGGMTEQIATKIRVVRDGVSNGKSHIEIV